MSTRMTWVALAATSLVWLAGCADPTDPIGSISAALCNPACTGDVDCPTLEPCAPRRCDLVTGSCYVVGYQAHGTVCAAHSWCNASGQCKLLGGQACTESAQCLNNNCFNSVCSDPADSGPFCLNNSMCAALDTCRGTPFCQNNTCRSVGTPLPAGSACTVNGQSGTCYLEDNGGTRCRYADGHVCIAASSCYGGYCLTAATGGSRCSSLSSCAACTVVDDAGTACVAAAQGASCGVSACPCTGPVSYTCNGGACEGVDGQCAGHFVCSGSACATSCNTNAECDTVTQCKTSTHQCLLINGQPCLNASECYTGYCLTAQVGKRCSALASCPPSKVINVSGTACIKP